MSDVTLFWHDYETWGVDPRRDRASQFAGVRTNLELEIVGKPVMHYCKPTADFLPHPEAVLVTGITPQKAFREGLNEAEFFRAIHAELAQPGTCGVGYNSIRFDDEVTRFGLYRNYYEPYAREWQNGNSRWDILDLVRMTFALRPEGIEWPQREDGHASFRLEHLTAANGIEHEGAHDAMVDVYATIGMAKLIRQHQPRLFDYYFGLRKKAAVSKLIDLETGAPFLHVSGMYPAERGCIGVVIPLLTHPVNSNEVIVFDLRQDPTQLLESSVEELQENLFTPGAEMPEGVQRVALKGVHINKSPAVAPLATLTPDAMQRWEIDLDRVEQHRRQILDDRGLTGRLEQLYSEKPDFGEGDADSALYDGFINPADTRLCQQVLQSSPAELAGSRPSFKDERLQTLYFRYRARNWPEYLSEEEQRQWAEFCRTRLFDGAYGSTLTVDEFYLRIEAMLEERQDERTVGLMKQLAAWPQELGFA
ncbi:exodeoxyribonuclease I [Solemya elarraichensis gill symbiont]|uniref:Exodeoxyribonuclease I n=1 Tax=Solemya elarraichensis gill symbiont TaxID=1918949 RepID=A0A1T2LCQ0_9GAMM|nr:exodeoxyribonuclease I [Solemya elarraichensis gill symbiont]OOZ42802.1 exodeoxyribonuclease I [Solemya elarraichensis gill symbiont]